MSRAARGVALAVGLALAAGALTVAALEGRSFGQIAAGLSLFIGIAGFAALALTARAANIRGDAPTSLDPPSRDQP